MMVDDKERVKFYSLAQVFLEEVSSELKQVGVVLEDHWMWDHICYRVDSLDRYAYWLRRLSQWGDLLIESAVGGRLIAKSLHQNAYRHFQIEERLLKLGGKNLRRKILEFRGFGYKTEPAFAKVLGLVGDPYESLLNLHKETEEVLSVLINKNSYSF